MQYEFLFDDKLRSISIEKNNPGNGAEFKANIDGNVLDFSFSKISQNSGVTFFYNTNKKVYAVSTDDKIYVHTIGKVYVFEKVLADKKSFSADHGEFGVKDRVASPMPGKIVKILVKEGETIKLKQPLVIVESMKMENEVRSPVDGTVKSVHFKSGDLVEPDQPIIMITPNEAAESKDKPK